MLSDFRSKTGYQFVYRSNLRFLAEFTHAGHKFQSYGHKSAREAAGVIIQWFRDLYGDEWHEWVRPEQYGKVQGAGWKITKVGRFFAADVCLLGVWYRLSFQKNTLQPKVTHAKRLIHAVMTMSPLFGERLLTPTIYQTPVTSLEIKATKRQRSSEVMKCQRRFQVQPNLRWALLKNP